MMRFYPVRFMSMGCTRCLSMRWVVLFLFLTLCPGPLVHAGTGAKILAAKPDLEQAIEDSARTGKAALKQAAEQDALMYELQDLELKAQWALFQNQQLDRWIRTEEDEIKNLSKKLAQAAENRQHLAPLMEVIYADLEAFVARDLPFLQEERQRRLAFLRQSFDDPSIGLAERLSGLLEAIQVEVDYGLTAHAQDIVFTGREMDGSIPSGHAEAPARYQGTELRIGRIGLFRITGREAFRYNRKTGDWDPLPPEQVRELAKAVEMVQKKRVAQVAKLPLGFLNGLTAEKEAGETKGGEK